MSEADLLGRAEVSVPEIMGARNWTVTKQLSAQVLNKNYGSVTIMGLRVMVCSRQSPIILDVGLC